MNVYIISDTHGNIGMVDAILELSADADLVIHLGDDYRDAIPFIDAKIPLIRVPGTWGREYEDPMIENRRFEDFLGWHFFLTHTPSKDLHDLPTDMDPEQVISDGLCDIFCHGHTHEPKISKMNDVVILNPGHLKAPNDRGFDASYANIIISNDACHIKIIDIQSKCLIDDLTIYRT